MRRENQPPLGLSTLLVALLTAAWAYVRLFLFDEFMLPLTFVLPMLIGVWTRRSWHVWSMAGVFIVCAFLKVFWLMPAGTPDSLQSEISAASTVFNVVIGAAIIQAIIAMRARMDASLARIETQNAELEAQSEEVAQQNEEIKAQTEELAQQNEEIESQAEELTGQNEELQETNERLGHREEILQGLLESARTPETGRTALAEVCRRALRIVGKPVECIAILKLDANKLRIKVQSSVEGGASVPAEWPIEGSIGGLVLQQDKSAYVSNLRQEARVAAPFSAEHPVQSILATPLRVGGAPYGVVVACSTHESHWTQEQFRVLEWVAAQCGLIAESLRWQNALAQRAREIEEANRAKDQFLAMLSHELRTPLTPVLAAAGVLENDPRIPEDAREDLRMIRRNVAIQSRLVDDLLDLTKLERGKLLLDAEELEMAALLKETAAIVAADLDAKDQRLDVDLGGVNGAVVNGDGARLQQVFWNLLKNAVKFSPPKGRIGFTARAVESPQPRIVVEVTDSGVGIDADNLDRIFRPFEQVVAHGKQRSGDAGLGLGLAIAKAIVDLHHGTIRAESTGVGQGATFVVELPLVPVSQLQVKSPQPRQCGVKAAMVEGALRILLVEDHGDTGRILARLLRNAGYLVEYSETAAGALERAANARFDLVISDLGLPDASGLELMPKLQAQQPWMRGICLSGYGMEDDLQACRDAGFAEHLTKPVDMQRLHAAIGRVTATIGT